MTPTRILLAAALLATTAAPALSDPTIEVGTLSCKGGEGVGLIVGSKKNYSCTFKPAGGGPTESYEASVTKIGLDIGFTTQSTIIWTVLSSSQNYEPRALAGNYAGANADASVGVGAGAKLLVGGSNNTIGLQPLSVQGQTGLNLAVGVAELQLR